VRIANNETAPVLPAAAAAAAAGAEPAAAATSGNPGSSGRGSAVAGPSDCGSSGSGSSGRSASASGSGTGGSGGGGWTLRSAAHAALAPTRWAHGEAVLMCLAASQILYSFAMLPDTLPPAYVHFIVRAGARAPLACSRRVTGLGSAWW